MVERQSLTDPEIDQIAARAAAVLYAHRTVEDADGRRGAANLAVRIVGDIPRLCADLQALRQAVRTLLFLPEDIRSWNKLRALVREPEPT